MTEEEKRRCCILGGCGCSPGGTEQRAAMKAWLSEKLASIGREGVQAGGEESDALADAWLDELFAGVPG